MKKLNDIEKEDLLKAVAKSRGSSKRRTTDGQLHEAREKLAKTYEDRFKAK